MDKTNILYITYDGLLEPLGQSQVLAYLRLLSSKYGYSIHIISFEKKTDWANTTLRQEVQTEVQAAGICWTALTYHRSPSLLATAFDIAIGSVVGAYFVVRKKIKIVHSRSYVASVPALVFKLVLGVRFVFDMRGFWADEKTESGSWRKNSRLYKVAKWFEMKFLLNADSVVSLTHAGVNEIEKFTYFRGLKKKPTFVVIPTCVDMKKFTLRSRAPTGRFTLGYVGSVDQWYRFEPAVECFKILQKSIPDARFLIINRDNHEYIKRCLKQANIIESAYEVRSARHSQIANEIERMHASVFFIKPSFAKLASAPTKLGELLAAGVPCLTSSGIGDMGQVLLGTQAGVVIDNCEKESLENGTRLLLQLSQSPEVGRYCREIAQRHFSIDVGASRYNEIYRDLA
jgi:glycosyltransferase involved in cell wall biosynthesis